MRVTANLEMQPGVDPAEAAKTIAEIAGVLSVVQVHPGDEDDHYARMFVVTLDPELAAETGGTLSKLTHLVKECELNLPRKVRPPKPTVAKPAAASRRH